MPKTIDNDVAGTDTAIGFDTALGIATGAIDNLHSTANSHNRIILAEIMGHRAGWLALGAGIAAGSDVILIPEIPYDLSKVAAAIRCRADEGKRFSIVAVAEGAIAVEALPLLRKALAERERARGKSEEEKAKSKLGKVIARITSNSIDIARKLEALTGQETRVTILGYLQRGGKPSAADRILATNLGYACATLIGRKKFGVMVAVKGDQTVTVPIEKVAGKRKIVPMEHPWLVGARAAGVCLGD